MTDFVFISISLCFPWQPNKRLPPAFPHPIKHPPILPVRTIATTLSVPPIDLSSERSHSRPVYLSIWRVNTPIYLTQGVLIPTWKWSHASHSMEDIFHPRPTPPPPHCPTSRRSRQNRTDSHTNNQTNSHT